MISDFKILRNNAFETAVLWYIVGLTAILRLLQKEKHYVSLIYSFYCCLVKKGRALKVVQQFAIRGLVAYKPVAYKKNKCNV